MKTIPQAQAKPSHIMAHRHMQRVFNRHRHKFDQHRAKGPAFAARLDELEKRLFGPSDQEQSSEG